MYKKLKILMPVLLFVLFGAIQLSEGLQEIDNFVYDYLLSSEREVSEQIVIVGIDERSINEIGTWPWPRLYVADAISKIADTEAAAIGVNVLYDTYGADEDNDMALVAAAGKTDRLVLAAMGILSDASSEEIVAEDYILPFDELAEVSGTGFINVMADESDGVMREALTSLKYGDITVHSLPFEVYRRYCDSMGIPANDIPLDRFGMFPIHYAAKPDQYTRLSLWGVINDEYNPSVFKDAIVLIGPYAQGIGWEDYTTPLEHRMPTYSVEINANIIQNMLEGSYKQEAQWWLNVIVLACSGLAAVVLLPRLKPAGTIIFTVLALTAQLLCTRLAYAGYDVILKAGAGILFLITCFLVNLVLNILSAQYEKQYIQGLFGRFVAPEVVKEIISGNVTVELGGLEKEITLIFIDIRGFTAFSEANPPDRVVHMVNRYLSLTSRSIQEHGGMIDKYIGDGTMGIFNAPNDLKEHALCAVKAAWDMKLGATELREQILEDYGVDLQFGIGINTGPAVVGNMGSDFRMEYTAIGDTVNTAARLEANAGKGQVLLSDATWQLVKDHVEVTDLGVLNVKNKKIGIQIYNLENVL